MISIQERLGLKTEPVEGAIWQWLCMLRCAMPGRVVSFDAVKQTCVVQPLIQELVLKPPPGAQTGPQYTTQNIPTNETIKPIQDVPIIMMRVPGWSITLPITRGTECLLIFNDMCIDGWWQNGQIAPQFDRRRHDLSDAMALFGPWSQPNVLSNYSTTSLQIRSDDSTKVIDLSPSKITITAPEVDVETVGGTPQSLLNHAFYTWFTTVFMPAVQYVSTEPALPTAPLTTVLKGQ
ncbi:MAG TPA: Gp138 family membrane-puncturing spike protein [Candidatus Saccharimonadales bacterium]